MTRSQAKNGSISRSTGRSRLVAFRLAEIPIEIRRRAASQVARQASSALPEDSAGLSGLLARLVDRAVGVDIDPKVLRRVAEHPSARVYWIPLEAWEEVMGQ